MKIVVASDHAGLCLKKEILAYLEARSDIKEVIDVGTYSEARTHYPIYARKAAAKVLTGEVDKAVIMCGTGIGISIAANKIKGIRACACSEPYSAMFSALHNNTNVLAMGSRVVGVELAKMIVDHWLKTAYEGGRHQIRLDMISDLENNSTIE
ncbi:ribose 5-phosphate isomerase B [Halanaerobium salsuginis]|jgi:ribose 5-phosphate isomerase B|uniref:Ribose-5-phosphate isomerase n=1 Tax=Halanaerobium salsuginis TaxID=29563 RepID=A0A1I4I2J0_9FIRM|nr:ribose 5-phosphate isomerase B [Halanaerobium salsuginis]SFL48638.1 ribose-5-phosphate isomerase [Halanaerobium salsuginis]